MYEELVKECRNKYRAYVATDNERPGRLFRDAADAIEALQNELLLCRNELCLRCGLYAERHKGACDDCRWRDM